MISLVIINVFVIFALNYKFNVMFDFPILSLILFVLVCYVLVSIGNYFNRRNK